MGRLIDDSVKQKLLDSLAKEPTMVISTAYAYAKNYVEYGEDITKAWTTAVQQASILEQVKVKAKAEAYDYFKKDYENCLKADMVAVLTDIQLDIEELKTDYDKNLTSEHGIYYAYDKSSRIVQNYINDLTSKSEEVKDGKID